MRIALVGLTYPFRGGIAHYTSLLYKTLVQKHEVKFFALKRQYPAFLFPGKTQLDLSEKPIHVENEPCLDSINPLSWIHTYLKINNFRPDLILFSWWNPFFAPAYGSVARMARFISRIPSCYICHNVFPHEHTWFDRVLLKYAFSPGTLFITHSEEDKQNLHRLRPKTKVYVNPHPTYEFFAENCRYSTNDAKQQLNLAGKNVILFFGYIRKYKGLLHLLEAMDRLANTKNYHLLVVGEFYDDRNPYENLIMQLKNQAKLTLVDRYIPNEEIPLFFSAADVVVAPYTNATQSGIVQMAYGFLKPVIASNVGGIPETINEDETGYIVPPGDPQKLAEAIKKFFARPDREQFKKHILRVKEKYSWENMIATIEEVYRDLK